jgi:hypothetical protein
LRIRSRSRCRPWTSCGSRRPRSRPIGVEIGQILFLLALLIAFFVTRPLLKRLLSLSHDHEVHWETLTTPAAYVIGGIASYWLIDRVSGFWT